MSSKVRSMEIETSKLEKTSRDKLREKWLKQLMEEFPDSSPYMIDCMIDLYLLDPNKTVEIINKHMNQ
jgi:hypothetical protein